MFKIFGYQYDNLNRLTNAIYQKPNNAVPVTNSYNERLTYDKNGNIISLQRNGEYDDAMDVLQIDNLTYSYNTLTPNQLISVFDTTNNPKGFNDGGTISTDTDFLYDANGNMIRDRNKNMDITYNHLNLPIKIIFASSNYIEYLYNAVGQKVKKNVKNGTVTTTTDYLSGYQYTNNILGFLPTAEGYVKNTVVSGVNNYNYIYNYTDHLGNIRLSYTFDTTTSSLKTVEENNYYPFGLKQSGFNMTKRTYQEIESGVISVRPADRLSYQYKYNGKEYQDELGLNMYDYGWRNYMSDIGRWTQIDPLFNDLKFANDYSQVDDEDDQEEVYMSIINNAEVGGGIYNTDNLNPYGYGYNNPISFDDPDGRCPSCIWGAVIGAGVDYGLQVAVNYAEGKSGSDAWTHVSLTSIAVSAGAGALSGGISSLKQVKNASIVAKIGVGMATDTGISVASQGIKKGKVTFKATVIDVAAGRLATGVGNVVGKKALNSSTGKRMAAAVNAEKNIARGKSNVIPKNKADVKGAVKKLEAYTGKRAAVSATVSSGAASTAAEKLEKNKK